MKYDVNSTFHMIYLKTKEEPQSVKLDTVSPISIGEFNAKLDINSCTPRKSYIIKVKQLYMSY